MPHTDNPPPALYVEGGTHTHSLSGKPLNTTLIYTKPGHDGEYIHRFYSRSEVQAHHRGNHLLRVLQAEDGITVFTPED